MDKHTQDFLIGVSLDTQQRVFELKYDIVQHYSSAEQWQYNSLLTIDNERENIFNNGGIMKFYVTHSKLVLPPVKVCDI